MRRAQAGQQGNGAQGIMLRVPHGPDGRQAEHRVRAGFQRAAGPVRRGQERELTPLLDAGRQRDEGQVRGNLPDRFREMVQVPVVKGIVFGDDTEDLHGGHLLWLIQN